MNEENNFMDDNDRQIFWETLCTLEGKYILKDREILEKVIKRPKYLYRYRPVNLKSIEALRYNKMYFSTSNYYDDPFDTFIHVDLRGMKNFFEGIRNDKDAAKKAEPLIKTFLGMLKISFTDAEMVGLLSALEDIMTNDSFVAFCIDYFRNIRNEIKKDTWSVCFSENGINETLWLKYAEQHKGFALRYDMENADNLLCGKQEKCSQCGIAQYGTPLYPMFYSNEKYNATRFAQYMAICTMLQKAGNIACLQQVNSLFGSLAWERERITLIKKECHKYDEEWRMIVPYYMTGKVMREWIPDAVILGLRMENDDRDLITDIAKQAGIRNIFQSFINDDGELDAYLLK